MNKLWRVKMTKESKGHTFYYEDELKDDFEKTKTLKRIDLPPDYKYIHKNIFFRIYAFILFWFIAKPVLHTILFFAGLRVKGRKNIKDVKKKVGSGFIYMNHTSFWDMVSNQVLTVTFRRCNIIGYTDALTLPRFVRFLTFGLGYLPLPTSLNDYRKFDEALKYYSNKKRFIIIFPEAHIWPYYTKIRPFIATSFKYPAKLNVPAIPVVTCYTKRRFSDKPKPTLYIGEAVYPKKELSLNENKEYMRNECYKRMVELANKHSTYSYYNYVKKDEVSDEKDK